MRTAYYVFVWIFLALILALVTGSLSLMAKVNRLEASYPQQSIVIETPQLDSSLVEELRNNPR